MMIVRTVVAAMFIATLAHAPAVSQQGGGPPPRREELEAQIFERFLDRVSTEMQLDAQGKDRLRQYLLDSGAKRRELTFRSVMLRRQLMQATREPSTNEDQFRRHMSELRRLRDQEHELARSDDQSLQRMLTPRQQAIFALSWIQFQERIRDVMMNRPPGGRRPPGGPGGPGF